MSSSISSLYEFIYRGQLAEESLDIAGRKNRRLAEFESEDMARVLSLDLLDDDHVKNAAAMSNVYIAIAAFENSVRDLISSVLLEQVGENWWETCVSEKIRNQADQKIKDEEKIRWHVQRGLNPINYTTMANLVSIIRQNSTMFEPFIHSVEWASAIMDVIERSRNVIMHSG